MPSYKLHHNNVDNYPSIWGEWDEKPTKEQLVDYLEEYYDEEKCNSIVEDLLKHGIADADESDSTVFTILH